MWYEFLCPNCQTKGTVMGTFANVPTEEDCPRCDSKMRRVYTVPVISIPEMNAVDVLNRHAAGEGDPYPGWTQEQTRYAANHLAKIQKEPKQYGKVPDFTSFPGGGSRRNFPDS